LCIDESGIRKDVLLSRMNGTLMCLGLQGLCFQSCDICLFDECICICRLLCECNCFLFEMFFQPQRVSHISLFTYLPTITHPDSSTKAGSSPVDLCKSLNVIVLIVLLVGA